MGNKATSQKPAGTTTTASSSSSESSSNNIFHERRRLFQTMALAGHARLGESSPLHAVASDTALLQLLSSFYRADPTPKSFVAENEASPSYSKLVKMVLDGAESVGKTQLMLRYCDSKFSTLYVPTIGVDFRVVRVRVPDGDGSGSVVKLQIWDTAGQERFYTITRSYFRSANAVMFVYDVNDPDALNKVQTHINSIKDLFESPEKVFFALVGNKCDLETQGEERITEQQIRDFAAANPNMITETFRVSAKDDINVTELFDTISSRTVSLMEASRGVV